MSSSRPPVPPQKQDRLNSILNFGSEKEDSLSSTQRIQAIVEKLKELSARLEKLSRNRLE